MEKIMMMTNEAGKLLLNEVREGNEKGILYPMRTMQVVGSSTAAVVDKAGTQSPNYPYSLWK
jgi:hypothetical protein